MKERPALFSAPMVRALLAGTKTQTRRVVKHHPSDDGNMVLVDHGEGWWPYRSDDSESPIVNGGDEIPYRCPYGQPGDRLWVRETFFSWGRWETRFSADKGRDEWHFIDMTLECGKRYSYAASDSNPLPMRGRRDAGVTPGWWKRPAIFMPRAASRILLEIVAIRVERLQDISEADALAEGIISENVIVGCNCYGGHHVEESADRYFFDGCVEEGFESAADAYAGLWESINGQGSWAANPWVWVLDFLRL